jgi:hypothetical protein
MLLILLAVLFVGGDGGGGVILAMVLVAAGWLLFKQDTRAALGGGPGQPGPGGPGGPGVAPPGTQPPGAPGGPVVPGPGYPADPAAGTQPGGGPAGPVATAAPAASATTPLSSAPVPAEAQAAPAEPPPNWPALGWHGGATATAERPTWPEPVSTLPPGPPPGWAPPTGGGRPRSILGRVTIGVMLVVLGGAAALDVAGAVDLDARHYLAIALAMLGLGLVVGSRVGRARWLIALGVLLLPVLVATSLLRVPIEGGVGDRREAPVTVAEIKDDYRMAAGRLVVDLSGVDLNEGTRRVRATLGMGELRVVVPDDAALDITTRVTGEADLLGRQIGDADGDEVRRLEDHYAEAGKAGGGHLQLDLETGVGVVRVYRASDEPANQP